MTSQLTRRDFLKLAALLPLAGSPLVNRLAPAITQPGSSSQPNVLIIVFDALTASDMSLYGFPRNTTPNINRFAQRATVFHNHYAGGNFTTSGTASLLTGALPWSNHAYHFQGTVTEPFVPRNLFNLAPADVFTKCYTHNSLTLTLLYQWLPYLDELVWPRTLSLGDIEYSDRLFYNDYNIALIGEKGALRQNEHGLNSSLFLSSLVRWYQELKASQINSQYRDKFHRGVPNQEWIWFLLEDGIDWTIEQASSMPQPYLAYFHFFPPHNPYTPRVDFTPLFSESEYSPPGKPESFASEGVKKGSLNGNRLIYDRFIAFVDSEFGRLVDRLEQMGVLDNTYLILTSDHGELFERGISGHTTPVLYEPLVHIPLVIAKPGVTTRQDVYDLTSCIDLLPTLLSLYGQSIPDWCEGQILPAFPDAPGGAARAVYAVESKDSPKHGAIQVGSFMIRRGDYKLLHYLTRPGTTIPDELYDLKNDPEEMENLIGSHLEVAADLQAELEEQLKQANQKYAQG